MQRWHLPSIDAVSKREPRVLFSTPQCRAVVIDFVEGDRMGEHQVRERAVVEVVSGRVRLFADSESVDCGPGTLVTFDPGERHAVEALEASRVLLLLAPWPADGHFVEGEDASPERLPEHAAVPPLS
jgi:quercetin dioxygenase-like cupin family protein